MKIKSGLLIAFIFFGSVAMAQKAASFSWLAGNWIIKTGKGIMLEKWKVTDDSTLVGTSFFIKDGKDTIPQESIELSFRNGNWSYIPTAIGQNNNQPVPFSILFQRGTEFIAENPEHDFPQRIAYRRIKDQLYASIEGKKNGKFGKQNFDFTLTD
jgi:Domain of unknown function (DUF6265)